MQELTADFVKALKRLGEALKEPRGPLFVDAVIQRFEFTFELAWKSTKVALKQQGIEANSPREVIKQAFKVGIIENGDGWLGMLDDRNLSSHVYDEDQAQKIENNIEGEHYLLLQQLERKLIKLV